MIAPVIGGALSEAFSWRATFVLLSAMTVPLSILSFYVLPETHHYFVVQRIAAANTACCEIAVVSDDIENQTFSDGAGVEMTSVAPSTSVPVSDASEKDSSKVIHLVEAEGMVRDRLVMPWESLGFIFDAQLAPYYTTMGVLFAS